MTKPLRVVSLFSGVGGFDIGLERAGMVTVAQVEWDKKCQGVLRRHWPDVPKFFDVSDVHGSDLPPCDLVAFGSPCQDLSVAGKRLGMVDGETRSGLFYEAIRVIREMQEHGRSAARTPVRWVVWENVVGALSSNGGADFGAVLDSLAGLGAVDVQWRILDAQHFGVPQRRRRVFVVARLDPRAAGREQVLPLGASVRRNPAAHGEAREAVAGTLGGGSGGRGWAPDTDRMTFLPEVVGTLSPGAHPGGVNGQDAYTGQLVPTLAFGWQEDRLAGTVYEDEVPGLTTSKTYAVAVPAEGVDLLNETTTGDVMPTVRGGAGGGNTMPHALAPVAHSVSLRGREGGVMAELGEPDIATTLKGGDGGWSKPHALTPDLAVRRLTPRECERLMGWPDDWTRWAADGSEVADSSRYRMCGNGVASPVAEWIGRCIVAAEQEVAQ